MTKIVLENRAVDAFALVLKFITLKYADECVHWTNLTVFFLSNETRLRTIRVNFQMSIQMNVKIALQEVDLALSSSKTV